MRSWSACHSSARLRAGRPRRLVPSPAIGPPPRRLTQKFPLNSEPVMAGASAGAEQSGVAATGARKSSGQGQWSRSPTSELQRPPRGPPPEPKPRPCRPPRGYAPPPTPRGPEPRTLAHKSCARAQTDLKPPLALPPVIWCVLGAPSLQESSEDRRSWSSHLPEFGSDLPHKPLLEASTEFFAEKSMLSGVTEGTHLIRG